MSYPFLGGAGRSYVQYLDEATGRMLQAQPGRTYAMQPVPGAGDVPVPPGDGLWGVAPSDDEDSGAAADEIPAEDETPADDASAPPGAPDQLARIPGRVMKPAADAAQEG